MKELIEVLQGVWSVLNGRWFIWRNASIETVEGIAELEFDESDAAELHEMVRQAKEELRLRGRG